MTVTSKWARVAITLAASWLIASNASATGVNVLVNPSFEDPQTDFSMGGAPEYPGAPGWTTFGGFFTVDQVTFAANAFDGNQAAKVFGVAGAYQEFSVNPLDLVTAGAYVINDSNDVMGPGQVAGVNLEWFKASGDPVTAGGAPIVSIGSAIQGDSAPLDVWTHVGVEGAAVPVGDNGVAEVVRMVIITGDFAGQGGGAPKFDAASLYIVPIPVPAAVWLFGSALGLLAAARRRIR